MFDVTFGVLFAATGSDNGREIHQHQGSTMDAPAGGVTKILLAARLVTYGSHMLLRSNAVPKRLIRRMRRAGHLAKRVRSVEFKRGFAAIRDALRIVLGQGRRLRALAGRHGHLIGNLVWGALIALLLFFLRDSPNFQRLEDLSVDWVMRASGLEQHQAIADRFLWFNIDDQTYRAWGEPDYTPRDKLQRLIRYAAEGGSELVIVDVDLTRRRTRPSDSPSDAATRSEQSADAHELGGDGDRILYDYLAAYPENCGLKNGCPPIVLVRAFRSGLPRASFLDPAVASSTRVFWASAQFESDDSLVIRRWRLWEPECGNGSADPVPSVELLVAALVDPKNPQTLAEKPKAAHDFLVRLIGSAEACPAHGQPPLEGNGAPNQIVVRKIVERARENRADGLINRVIYTVPWRTDDTAVSRPAMQLVNAPVPDRAAFSGKIVVIGGSFQESGDIHPTPLGSMPGSFALINAVASLERHGLVTHTHGLLNLFIEIALVVLMSLCFLLLPSLLGMVISSAAIVCILVPVCIILLSRGLWIDFALPLVAVQLHELVARLEELVRRRSGGGGHNAG